MKKSTAPLDGLCMFGGDGMVNIVIAIKIRGRDSPNIASLSCPHIPIAMSELMMLGGFGIAVTHLYRIM